MNEEIGKQIPKTAKEFRYADLVMKLTANRDDGQISGFMYKDTKTPSQHFHIYLKDNKPYMHLKLERSEQRLPIDYEKFLLELGNALADIFSSFEKVELTDSRFIGKDVNLISNFNMKLSRIKPKEVYFEHELDQDFTIFENIDTAKNSLGVICDEIGNETHMVIVKDGDVFVISLEEVEKKGKNLNYIMHSHPEIRSDLS